MSMSTLIVAVHLLNRACSIWLSSARCTRPGGIVGHSVEDILERPVLLHQRHRRLLADARDAGDVVARIPLQRLEIDDQRRLEPVAFADLVDVVDDRVAEAATARENADVLGDELEHVEVAGDDDHVESRSLAPSAPACR